MAPANVICAFSSYLRFEAFRLTISTCPSLSNTLDIFLTMRPRRAFSLARCSLGSSPSSICEITAHASSRTIRIWLLAPGMVQVLQSSLFCPLRSLARVALPFRFPCGGETTKMAIWISAPRVNRRGRQDVLRPRWVFTRRMGNIYPLPTRAVVTE